MIKQTLMFDVETEEETIAQCVEVNGLQLWFDVETEEETMEWACQHLPPCCGLM